MAEYVFIRGKFVPAEEANISIKTVSLHYGLGVFEGIRAYYNSEQEKLYVFHMKEHYERLLRNMKVLFMRSPYTVEELCEITVELLKRNGYKADVYIRPLAYFKDESVVPTVIGYSTDIAIFAVPLGAYIDVEKGVRVKVSSFRKVHDNELPSKNKICGAYVNSALANAEAKLEGYHEAVLLTHDGFVAEGSGENLFIVRGGKAITPPVFEDILEGITRNSVIELLKNELGVEVVERRIGRGELYLADEMFFTGTAAQVCPIVEVDRRPVGDGKPGPITKSLQKVFFDVVRGKVEKYRHWLTPVE